MFYLRAKLLCHVSPKNVIFIFCTLQKIPKFLILRFHHFTLHNFFRLSNFYESDNFWFKVDASWVTQHKFAAAFIGSEIVVAGRLSPAEGEDGGADGERHQQQQQAEEEQGDFWGEVSGVQASGEVSTVHLPDAQLEFYPATKFNPNLSHLWAYLTVYQLLVGSAARDSREEATHIALEVYTKNEMNVFVAREATPR